MKGGPTIGVRGPNSGKPGPGAGAQGRLASARGILHHGDHEVSVKGTQAKRDRTGDESLAVFGAEDRGAAAFDMLEDFGGEDGAGVFGGNRGGVAVLSRYGVGARCGVGGADQTQRRTFVRLGDAELSVCEEHRRGRYTTEQQMPVWRQVAQGR